jgi:hypothetical protein
MQSHLDHIVVVASSLAAGSDFVAQALGVLPGPGRKHPHMGTHNLLLGLGASAYIEVVAVDPEAAPISRPRWFGLDSLPSRPLARLAAWVANTTNILSHASPALGPVETMQREGMTWQMTATPDGMAPMGGAAPLLIQRHTNFHPASRLPESNLRLRMLRIRHPAPAEVAHVLAHMDLAELPQVDLAFGEAIALSAEIDTPQGTRTLGSV